DITQAILDGRQPRDLTADKLLAHSRLPLAWHDQRTVLGLREPRSGLNAQPTSARPEATRFALGRFRHGRHNRPAALRYWNKDRQRYCRPLVRYCSTLRVSADRAANRAAHTRGKPRLLDVGRRIPARDKFAPDSPLERRVWCEPVSVWAVPW